MHIYKKDFWKNSSNVWKWLGFTILPSMLPFFVTTFAASLFDRSQATEYIHMTDIIFMGLTISIGNFHQLYNGVHESIGAKAMVSSITCITFLSMLLGGAQIRDGLPLALSFFAIGVVIWTMHISYIIMKTSDFQNNKPDTL